MQAPKNNALIKYVFIMMHYILSHYNILLNRWKVMRQLLYLSRSFPRVIFFTFISGHDHFINFYIILYDSKLCDQTNYNKLTFKTNNILYVTIQSLIGEKTSLENLICYSAIRANSKQNTLHFMETFLPSIRHLYF